METYNRDSIFKKPGAENSSDNRSRTKSSLMSVEEMGKLLGLGKTSRYGLLKKNLFETKQVLGKQWILRDSFDRWYAGQDRYHIVDCDDPEAVRISGALTIREIADLIGRSKQTVSRLIRENGLETITCKNCLLVPMEVFQSWIAGQNRYTVHENLQEEIPEKAKLQPEEQESTQNSARVRHHNPMYLTVREASVLAGVSQITVYSWIRNSNINARRCGKEIYISKNSFNLWLKQRGRI